MGWGMGWGSVAGVAREFVIRFVYEGESESYRIHHVHTYYTQSHQSHNIITHRLYTITHVIHNHTYASHHFPPLPQVKDYYGKPEILFCGPDENTADLMEWAALYARKRGYPYWKAFTTGKPQSLGGIPHDLYGMTTNSVHQFVLETLQDHGLKVCGSGCEWW